MESRELKIVRVLPEDNYKLLKISRETFYEAFGPPANTEENIQAYLDQNITLEKITYEILHPESRFFFIFYLNQIVGYIKINFRTAQTEIVQGKSVEIERIYIINTYQGKGIGKYTLDRIIEIAKEQKLEFIWLGVWEKNLDAIQFYNRNDFKIFAKHKFMLGSDEQTDLMLKLILK
ncbi:GNAT family N-acetyltransferase [Aquimarina sp. SS2-1]|uniref:GNAT family N-acetyltransferase n=1 Tax=Aquimarina besae TaxID=3342247 RepID=UPI00367004C9